jgi:hypothetical protein
MVEVAKIMESKLGYGTYSLVPLPHEKRIIYVLPLSTQRGRINCISPRLVGNISIGVIVIGNDLDGPSLDTLSFEI